MSRYLLRTVGRWTSRAPFRGTLQAPVDDVRPAVDGRPRGPAPLSGERAALRPSRNRCRRRGSRACRGWRSSSLAEGIGARARVAHRAASYAWRCARAERSHEKSAARASRGRRGPRAGPRRRRRAAAPRRAPPGRGGRRSSAASPHVSATPGARPAITGIPACHGLEHRQPEALVQRGMHERGRLGVAAPRASSRVRGRRRPPASTSGQRRVAAACARAAAPRFLRGSSSPT